MALSPTGIDSQRNQWSPDHRASLCMLCSGFFATNRPYVRLWPYLSGQGHGRARCVSSQLTARRAARHRDESIMLEAIVLLLSLATCALIRPAPHQKALSGARHRQPDRRNGTDFADGDFLVACHHGSWIGSRYEALTSRPALSTSSASLSSMRMTLLFAAPSAFRSSSSLA